MLTLGGRTPDRPVPRRRSCSGERHVERASRTPGCSRRSPVRRTPSGAVPPSRRARRAHPGRPDGDHRRGARANDPLASSAWPSGRAGPRTGLLPRTGRATRRPGWSTSGRRCRTGSSPRRRRSAGSSVAGVPAKAHPRAVRARGRRDGHWRWRDRRDHRLRRDPDPGRGRGRRWDRGVLRSAARELHVEPGRPRLGRPIVGISLANFRLRERLESSERRYQTLSRRRRTQGPVSAGGTILEANDRRGALRRMADRAPCQRDPRRGPGPGRSLAGDPRSRRVVTASARPGAPMERTSPRDRASPVRLDGEPRISSRPRPDRAAAPADGAHPGPEDGGDRAARLGRRPRAEQPAGLDPRVEPADRSNPDLSAELRESADMLVDEAHGPGGSCGSCSTSSGHDRPNGTRPTIRALIDSVLELQSYILGKSGIDGSSRSSPGLPRVPIDRGQLQQVLVNLTVERHPGDPDGWRTGRLAISARQGPRSMDERQSGSPSPTTDPGSPPQPVGCSCRSSRRRPRGDGTGLGLPVSFGIIRRTEDDSDTSRRRAGAAPRSSSTCRRAVERETTPARATRIADEGAGPARPAVRRRPTRRRGANGGAGPRPGRGDPRVLVLDDEPSIRTFLERALAPPASTPVVLADRGDRRERGPVRPSTALLVDHRMAGMSGIDAFDDAVASRARASPSASSFMSGDVLNPELRDVRRGARHPAARQAVRHRDGRLVEVATDCWRSATLALRARRQRLSGARPGPWLSAGTCRTPARSSGRGGRPRRARRGSAAARSAPRRAPRGARP